MNYGLLILTFCSVNLDFFLMLLFLLKKYRFRSVLIGYLLGNLLLLVLSYVLGRTLATFLPEWILGFLGLLPIYLAFHDDDDDNQVRQHHSAIFTVLITYLSVCSGCNLAIFLPVLAGETWSNFGRTLILIGGLTILAVGIIKLVGKIPPIERILTHYGEKLMKICYVVIGLYVFWDSGLISHLLSLL
ncbi:TMEM165/GDT1 family protein [Lactobacillus sp. DCY120]|uniref:TMEM165/GDT1 family protein n=1 Tax=Bombilactobacillus apium TaxID=2675299 RepID=A0A850R166_9LACO|nr:cadmium resistance transporter [Bombilactobacillus apium]NVY96100.1 TMEM165/GDT1 family protein [Bombilactobacillus apium]